MKENKKNQITSTRPVGFAASKNSQERGGALLALTAKVGRVQVPRGLCTPVFHPFWEMVGPGKVARNAVGTPRAKTFQKTHKSQLPSAIRKQKLSGEGRSPARLDGKCLVAFARQFSFPSGKWMGRASEPETQVAHSGQNISENPQVTTSVGN